MKFLFATAALLGLAAAAPSVENLNLEGRADRPSFVQVKSVKAIGSGCPKNQAQVTVDQSTNTFTVSFQDFIVETPGSARDRRKNCKIDVLMDFEQGWQFSVMSTNTVGFAEIPKGITGTCQNDFSFSQNPTKIVSAVKKLKGKWDGTFSLPADVGIVSWSQCGDHSGLLNINSQCWLPKNNNEASIAVDALSGTLNVKFAVQWRRC